jgi:uracil-DNA glycosylase
MKENTMMLEGVDRSWQACLSLGLQAMDKEYMDSLYQSRDWLPGVQAIFAAFSQPISAVSYVLLGESPYPRVQSANGYAFWDAAVGRLWSLQGFSKAVNRATSLRNFMKMLLVARGDLASDNISQYAIAQLDHCRYLQTAEQLFSGMIAKGFLLLNATLVYRDHEVSYHAKQWRSFFTIVIDYLASRYDIKWIVLGNIAKKIVLPPGRTCLTAEHPYNISFITNQAVLSFFNPLDLLTKS